MRSQSSERCSTSALSAESCGAAAWVRAAASARAPNSSAKAVTLPTMVVSFARFVVRSRHKQAPCQAIAARDRHVHQPREHRVEADEHAFGKPDVDILVPPPDRLDDARRNV